MRPQRAGGVHRSGHAARRAADQIRQCVVQAEDDIVQLRALSQKERARIERSLERLAAELRGELASISAEASTDSTFEAAQNAGFTGNQDDWVAFLLAGYQLQQGVSYYDVPASTLYITYGVDGDWSASKHAPGLGEVTTGENQTGSVPTTLSALQALTYS